MNITGYQEEGLFWPVTRLLLVVFAVALILSFGASCGGKPGSGGSTVTQGQDPDTDGDGLSDEDEATCGSNPEKADGDNDGLNDFAECIIHLTDPNNADSDDDGMEDGVEVDQKSDPMDPDDDKDGYDGKEDCEPLNAKVNPGAFDEPNNGEDPNCSWRLHGKPDVEKAEWTFPAGYHVEAELDSFLDYQAIYVEAQSAKKKDIPKHACGPDPMAKTDSGECRLTRNGCLNDNCAEDDYKKQPYDANYKCESWPAQGTDIQLLRYVDNLCPIFVEEKKHKGFKVQVHDSASGYRSFKVFLRGKIAPIDGAGPFWGEKILFLGE